MALDTFVNGKNFAGEKFNLQEKEASPCKDGGTHNFVSIHKPTNNRSGWHEDKCSICGVVVNYDTGD